MISDLGLNEHFQDTNGIEYVLMHVLAMGIFSAVTCLLSF